MKEPVRNVNQYFEGVLQLRNPNGLVIDFINNQVKGRKGVFISKSVQLTNGFDLYFSSQRFLQNLGRKLQKNFGGEMKISRKLFTKKRLTSRLIYRANVLFRLPLTKKGDIIKIRGEDVKIIGMSHRVLGKSVETGKKIQIDYEDLP